MKDDHMKQRTHQRGDISRLDLTEFVHVKLYNFAALCTSHCIMSQATPKYLIKCNMHYVEYVEHFKAAIRHEHQLQ